MGTSTRASEMILGRDAVIETYVDGRGPALVVLPSYGRDGGRDFDVFADLVAKAGFQVLRPQPRGIGRSSGSMQASLQDMANDVARVIQQLAGGHAIVLGHAFGNGVARLLATSHGELVKGTILASASNSAAPRDINETPFIAGNPTLSEKDRLAALSRAFFAPHHDARQWLNGWYPETLHMQRTAVQAVNPAEFSRAGTAPILQIIAESDPFNPFTSWRELREECGCRVTTRIVADASHALFPEQTPLVADVVIGWLQSIWR
jgi:pimeloyl-ACP methyl ester carboxylesterase